MAIPQFLSSPDKDGPLLPVKISTFISGHDARPEAYPGPIRKTKEWAGKMDGVLHVGMHDMVFSGQYENFALDQAPPPFTIPRTIETRLPLNTMISAGVKVTFANKQTFCTQAAGIVWPTATPVSVIDECYGVQAMIEIHGVQLLPNCDMVGVSVLRFFQDQFGRDKLRDLISKVK